MCVAIKITLFNFRLKYIFLLNNIRIMETETILEDCAKQIITEFLTEDDEFLTRVYLRLYP